MDKNGVFEYLDSAGVPYERVEHGAVFTVEDMDALSLPHPEAEAKNLFLRDQKKQNYYLLTARADVPIKIKEFEKTVGAKHLSFASEDDLMSIMGLVRGSVTPFGVFNDAETVVKVYIDSYFDRKLIGVHPNENTATVYLSANSLVEMIRAHGNTAEFIDIAITDEV